MSSWWAIQASVRPSRTQARIWFSCDLSGLPAIRRVSLSNSTRAPMTARMRVDARISFR